MRVSGAAKRTSQAAAMTAPAPQQTPWSAATTGGRVVRMAWTRAPVMRVNSRRPGMSRSKSWAMMSLTSPPEQKPRGPSPFSTIARTAGYFSFRSRKVSRSSP